MAEVNYDVNMVYASFAFIVYKYLNSNYDIIELLRVLNYEWLVIIIINVIGLYLLLKGLKFQIQVTLAYR
jgi:hypothetical protein